MGFYAVAFLSKHFLPGTTLYTVKTAFIDFFLRIAFFWIFVMGNFMFFIFSKIIEIF